MEEILEKLFRKRIDCFICGILFDGLFVFEEFKIQKEKHEFHSGRSLL